jgi:DNA-binding NarL/FixJ family response regulator
MRVLLADDHPLFLDGLKNLLSARGVKVAGTAHTGLEALEMARSLRPDVILMDIQMPGCDGLMAGYLLKTQDTEEFMRQLLELERGEAPLARGMAARILNEFRLRTGPLMAPEALQDRKRLSPRQLAVLALVARGLTYKQVAAELCLSERTIKYHMAEVIARLHLTNRAAVVQYAKRTGLVRS